MSNVVIERRTAYGAVVVKDGEYRVVIVEQGVPDYVFDPVEPTFPTYGDASCRATEKNKAMNLDRWDAWKIIDSSMTASRTLGKHWGPR